MISNGPRGVPLLFFPEMSRWSNPFSPRSPRRVVASGAAFPRGSRSVLSARPRAVSASVVSRRAAQPPWVRADRLPIAPTQPPLTHLSRKPLHGPRHLKEVLVFAFQQAPEIRPRAAARTRCRQHECENPTRSELDVGEIDEVGSQSRVAVPDRIGQPPPDLGQTLGHGLLFVFGLVQPGNGTGTSVFSWLVGRVNGGFIITKSAVLWGRSPSPVPD